MFVVVFLFVVGWLVGWLDLFLFSFIGRLMCVLCFCQLFQCLVFVFVSFVVSVFVFVFLVAANVCYLFLSYVSALSAFVFVSICCCVFAVGRALVVLACIGLILFKKGELFFWGRQMFHLLCFGFRFWF